MRENHVPGDRGGGVGVGVGVGFGVGVTQGWWEGGLPCRSRAYKRVSLLDARQLHVERASLAHDGNV